jgi:hypothetical protein
MDLFPRACRLLLSAVLYSGGAIRSDVDAVGLEELLVIDLHLGMVELGPAAQVALITVGPLILKW